MKMMEGKVALVKNGSTIDEIKVVTKEANYR
jgi:hypothetical protein